MDRAYSIVLPKIARTMYYLSILYATTIYYRGDVANYTGSGIKDLPKDSILSHYDFVIIGGGSAGKNNTYYTFSLVKS